MKALVGALNQENALVGAFSVLIKASRRFVSGSTLYTALHVTARETHSGDLASLAAAEH